MYPHVFGICGHRGDNKCSYEGCLLQGAIYHLDVKTVQKEIDKLESKDLLNFNPYPKINHNQNVLERICMSLRNNSFTSLDREVKTINDKANKYGPVDKNILTIIEILVKKCPELIIKKCYDDCIWNFNREIITIMDTYIIEDDNSICCFICTASSLQDELFYKVCECKEPIHYKCFVKVINTFGMNCTICTKQFRINESRYEAYHLGSCIRKVQDIFSPSLEGMVS